MGNTEKKNDDISIYLENREYIANTYVFNCFTVSMVIYLIAFVLDLLGIFVVDKQIMTMGFIPSLLIYLVVFWATKKVSLTGEKTKYFILGSIIAVYTIMGVTITYHVVLVSVLPFLYATLYSSKRVTKYVYILSVISTFVVVYGGYYWGLCDANMALLTISNLSNHASDGRFLLTEVNANPGVTLMLFYVVPRCLIQIALLFVCNSIYKIVSGSIEKARLTAELEHAKEDAENANRAKTQFLARMSHEIRTPINAVIGINEMILRETEETETKEYARDIRNSTKTLLSIINEILDSSKIESGKMEIIPDNYDINSLLNDLHNMISLKAQDKGLELLFEIEPDIPKEYYGDDIRIRQVLVNLLTNAVKYTERGTVSMSVSSTTEGDKAILHYTVKDTGIGIKEEDLSRIYDQFERFDESRNRHIEGTGLGMSITRQLLLLMGSELKIKSEYGKGSEFSFDIEQVIVNAEPLGEFKAGTSNTIENGYYTKFIAPNARVLVVDDNEMNRKVFRSLLKQTQMNVYEAQSGEECITILEKQKVDIVFLDYMMPELDGVETLRIMRKRNLCVDIPVIMLTANAVAGAREQYLQEGFDDYLSKPIVPDKLEKMIQDYLPKELIEEPVDKQKDSKQVPEGLPELDEFDFEYALGLLKNEELLKHTLVDFYESMERVEDKLESSYANIGSEAGMHSYRIEVHALKSTAATVGALLLSKTARLLELAAIRKDAERISVLHPVLMEELQVHKERIATILPKEEEKEPISEIREILPYLEMLKVNLENENYDAADYLCERIKTYRYSDEIKVLVRKMSEHIMYLEAEEAIEVLEEIYEKNTVSR